MYTYASAWVPIFTCLSQSAGGEEGLRQVAYSDREWIKSHSSLHISTHTGTISPPEKLA